MPGTLSFPKTSSTALAIAAGAVVVLSGCGPKHRLAEYDFRGRTIAVVTIAPPHPEVLSGASLGGVDPDDPIQAVLRVGSEVMREAQVHQVRERLDSAAAAVDVSGRMAERTLDNAARHLRATPVTDGPNPDFELELRVERYGIVAASWTSDAYFTIDATVLLLDGRTGRRIWSTDMWARDPVRTSVVGVDNRSIENVITAAKLATMSTEEIRRALESLADFAADVVVRELAKQLDDARG